MKNQTKEGCTELQTPKEELLIRKCWRPNCTNIAVVRDGAGWEWCDKHLNQENSDSPMHTEVERYDIAYYRGKAKAMLKETEQRVVRGCIKEIDQHFLDTDDFAPPLRESVSDFNGKLESLQEKLKHQYNIHE